MRSPSIGSRGTRATNGTTSPDRLATKAARSQSGGSGDSLSGVDLDDPGPVSGLASAGGQSGSDNLGLFGSEPPADELKLF